MTTSSDESRLWVWLGLSGALLLLTVVGQVPGPIRLGAALCAAGIWVAGRAGVLDGLRDTVHPGRMIGEVSIGTLLYGWGIATVGAGLAAALTEVTAPTVWLAGPAAIAFAVLTLASRVLMVVAAAIVLTAPLWLHGAVRRRCRNDHRPAAVVGQRQDR